MTGTDLVAIVPEILVALTAFAVVVADAALPRHASRRMLPLLVVAGLVVALLAPNMWSPYPERVIFIVGAQNGAGQFFGGFVNVDEFTNFFRAVFIVLAIFATVVAPSYLERKRIPSGEYYATVLFSTLGAMTIALSTDLITLFVGLELMTIPIYVLAGIQRRDRYANEAALKYFLLGAFSSALLVYGFAWLFGVTGSTRFGDIAVALKTTGIGNGPTIVALALVTVGLGFKAAVVPFHQWTPDAYDGAPTPATAFMSVGPKAAAFAAILRVLVGGMGPLVVDWSTVFAVLAAVTMTVGNVVALVQTNTKRMLAYSSIAHTGYILAAVAATAAGPAAGAAVLFYVFAYGLMNLGAFACLLYVDLEGTRGATLSELNGFARRHGLGALVFAVFLVSLTGIPPTVGFVAKFLVIQPVLDAGYAWLAVILALNAVLAAFYYLRVVVHMYMYDPESGAPALVSPRLLSISLGVSAVAVVVLGILPNSLYQWALNAAVPIVP
ncbi:MAG TPA: NADH-quinone oxidoreductase subunit N [Candidatus Limnocylindria bacterium]|nr:NADH-quinone oxidoreductase subunit N [Candidatus Limnocylindria bacterium]